VSPLDRPLHIAAERHLLGDAGNDRTHEYPQQHGHERVPRDVKILLLGERDDPVHDPLKEHYRHEAEAAGTVRPGEEFFTGPGTRGR